MGKECGMHGSECNLEQIFLLEKERVYSYSLCEYGRIILQWNLRNCTRVDFDNSCFGRALNDILMNLVMNHKFHKILGNIVIS
jgi:hypothetical protein